MRTFYQQDAGQGASDKAGRGKMGQSVSPRWTGDGCCIQALPQKVCANRLTKT